MFLKEFNNLKVTKLYFILQKKKGDEHKFYH